MRPLKLLTAAMLAAAAFTSSAHAQATGQTPTQPTANDPSLGLPSQAATTTGNPVAMDPQAARSEGTTPAAPDKGVGGK